MSRSPDGAITTTPDGGPSVEFLWYYDRPIEAVWAALTEPARLSRWLSDVEIDLRVGGMFRILWRPGGTMEGVITELTPPLVIAYTWNEPSHEVGESVVRWELSQEGDGCLLRLTHTFPLGADATPFVAGWHDFLYPLLAAVDGFRSEHDTVRSGQIEGYYDRLSSASPRE